jgi:hypothetical protein
VPCLATHVNIPPQHFFKPRCAFKNHLGDTVEDLGVFYDFITSEWGKRPAFLTHFQVTLMLLGCGPHL